MTLATFPALECAGVAGAQTPPMIPSAGNDLLDRGAHAIRRPVNGQGNQMWRPAVSGL